MVERAGVLLSGIISDEGGIFDIIAGKYSSGRVNMDVFLKFLSDGRAITEA